jgi:hypothetical protein
MSTSSSAVDPRAAFLPTIFPPTIWLYCLMLHERIATL